MEFVSVDVEADGPIPGRYSMLSFGAVLVSNPQVKFYKELKPITDEFTAEALQVSGFNRELLKQYGEEPSKAMNLFAAWLDKHCKTKPKMVAYPIAFDWQFINWYFHNFLGRNPFGIAGADIRSIYYAMFPSEDGFSEKKSNIKARLGVTAPHTHNALDDAYEQALIMQRLVEIRNGDKVTLQ